MSDLPGAWSRHCAAVQRLLGSLTEGALADAGAPRERSAGAHLAHVHSCRRAWVEAASPALAANVPTVGRTEATDQRVLSEALSLSGEAVGRVLIEAVERDGRVRGVGLDAPSFMASLIAHAWYHIGKVDAIVRRAGHAPADDAHYGLFDWKRPPAATPE